MNARFVRPSRLAPIIASAAFMGALAWKASAQTAPSRHDTWTVPIVPAAVVGQPVAVGAARAAPVTLTASDGTGLVLSSMVARAEVQDPLAFTELRMTFQNPQARPLEGTFRITLPEGASVSRFAMKVNGEWQEGEVVEKRAARAAYEDFLHRKQDPALLEQAAGNEFSARVFPIPPSGVKEIILSYSQELGAGATYTLPLKGLPQLGVLDVGVMEASADRPVQTLVQRRYIPDTDFVLDARFAKKNPGLRSGNMVLAKVVARGDVAKDPIGGTVILVDSSASRALGWKEQIALTKDLVSKIGARNAEAPLRVAAFDQVVVPMFSGKASELGPRSLDVLADRLPLGASNLERALTWAGEEAKKAGITRIVVIGDGVATAGATEGEELGAAIAKLRANGVARVDAVAVGGIRDSATLKRLVGGRALPRDGVVIDGALGAQRALARLDGATLANVTLEVPGAKWFWPANLEGTQDGDEVIVYADVPDGRPFSIAVGGKPAIAPELRPAERPLIERAWVQAKISSLVAAQAKSARPERAQEILDLSVTHRVLSPLTALLVLETEQDYARFAIDRRSLKDVLTMEQGHLALRHRSWPFDGKKSQVVVAEAPRQRQTVTTGDNKEGGTGTRAKGEEGSMGNPTSAATRFALQGPADNNAPGSDPMSARGNMWGGDIGDAFGAGGLGLAGVGEGGGGRAEGIGLGNIGTLGHGSGTAMQARAERETEAPSGAQAFGNGHGRVAGNHATSAPRLASGTATVSGRIPPEVIQRIVRQNFGRFRLCYERGLARNPNLQGRVVTRFQIDRGGAVMNATDGGSDLPDNAVVSCVADAMTKLSFPQPEGGVITVSYPINFMPSGGSGIAFEPGAGSGAKPYTGKLANVMAQLASKETKAALDSALAWHSEEPGDVLGLIALGEAYEASGTQIEAARAYGSLVDLFAARADLRRFAGERLERLKDGAGLELAIDTYKQAKKQRPDHPASHRLLAYARLRQGDLPGAFDAALDGARRQYPDGRFGGVDRILREDLGLIGAAWLHKDPSKRAEIMRQLREANATLETAPSLRFVLNWETDANDVDFHIFDSRGGHAYYGEKDLPSGGSLYEDVTTGYGPECFTIRKAKAARSGPYQLQAHYYSRGPMGYGMGKLEIIDHDGSGNLKFQERPYVVMVDHAFIDLGTVD